MTRNGKIARLPRHIRDELNHRLDNGQQGKSLVEWLNTLDEVRDVLATDFDGRPINEQNLTEWKQGGLREWKRQREASDYLHRLVERAKDLEHPGDGQNLPDLLAEVLASELAAETQRLLEETPDPAQRWRYLRQALRQLHLLRRGDARAAHARMEQTRWEIECGLRKRQEMKEIMAEAREYVMEPIKEKAHRRTLVAAYGGGESAEKAADFILEMERKYRVSRFEPPPERPDSPPADQTQSG